MKSKMISSLVILLSANAIHLASAQPIMALSHRTSSTQAPIARTTTATPSLHPTPTSSPAGETIVVNSTADSGPGSLRRAIESALPGNTITFDPSVFPPTSPDTITLVSGLPELLQGNLTIDASDVGVIVDGSKISTPEYVTGLSVTSDYNIIRGLQIAGFSDAGIALRGGAQNNMIGGDRNIGAGPLGQGNLVRGDGDFGMGLWDEGTSFNTIRGNIIGTDLSGTTACGGLRDGIHSNGANYNLVVDNLIGGYETGVYFCCASDGNNTIRGNYIGTDARGIIDVGNSRAGITIDRSGSNVVGPSNVIAHNGGPGIAVHGEGSGGNRITRNSVHGNGGLGIELWQGGNTDLASPVLLDFDRQAGIVTGSACANCSVEIFSGNDNEGAVYEGQTTANNAGFFTFNKGASFTGSFLTATATDADGNTSQFSVHTPDTPTRTLILQESNSLPKTRLEPKRSRELADNRIGSFWDHLWPAVDNSEWSDKQVFALGLKHARLAINSIEWDRAEWSMSDFIVAPTHDDHVTSFTANGMTLNYVLSFWDKANHPEGWEEDETYSRFQTDEEIQRYLEFVQFIVNHFKDRIQYFELWNEPDNGGFPVQHIKVPDYINLVKRTVPVIRQEYPEAKIVVGSTSNLRFTHDYLLSILRSDEIMPLVDVIAWHPMYGSSPAHEDTREYYYDYPSIVQGIKDTASAHGFRGEYRADELGWGVYPTPDFPWTHSPIQTVKYYARGTVMHLGMDMTAVLAAPSNEFPIAFATIRNLCTVMAGARPDSVSIQIQSDATNIRSYGFSLASGDKLIALWTDGAAVDDDPGVATTLTLPGFLDQRMTGIDVLNGFHQELVTESENGNLVIRNLIVKDYPIILSSGSVASIATDGSGSPVTYALFQNYPNPFNPRTRIEFSLEETGQTMFVVHDLLGREVKRLVSGVRDPGHHSVTWDGTDQRGRAVASGVYVYTLTTPGQTTTRKLVLMR